MEIKKRKDAHIDITLKNEVDYTTHDYFNDVIFLHNSLPELNLSDIDLTCSFFGKKVKSPIIVGSMTGGTEYSKQINQKLAEFAEKNQIPLGLGSIRPVLENSSLLSTFDVSDIAQTVPKFANIGMAQLIPSSKGFDERLSSILSICDKLRVEGIAIHLNPLQEIVQPEGDNEFNGCIEGIKILRKTTRLKLIVKETGAGINEFIAQKLDDIKVDYIDVNGSLGTSWSKVEYLRKGSKVEGFDNWGNNTLFLISTAKRRLKFAKLIAGGGLNDGIKCAKSIALGAQHCSIAKFFLRSMFAGSLQQTYDHILEQIKTCMLLTGSKNLTELQNAKLIITGKLKEELQVSKIDVSDYYFRP
ncbi:MAG: type 2 isopentenyl-diphosphate Delta-isomerase [Candidatus Micrarchaeota archaeon]|nr:type 2 isopentenyl-diphosphate Delta-isomerase [Candidatus Micrarchaeota archaeon]